MNRDKQIVEQVENALDGNVPKSTAFTMEAKWIAPTKEGEKGEFIEVFSYRVGGPDPSLPLEELERNADIARARYLVVCEEKEYWNHVIQRRTEEFNNALIAFYKKKHKLTDVDLEEDWPQDINGVYEKRVKDEG